MKKKLLLLFYRYPAERGEMASFGQHLFYSVLSNHFEAKGLTFSNRDYSDENMTEVKLQNNNIRKIINLIFKLRSSRLTHYFSKEFLKEYKKIIKDFNPDCVYVDHTFMMQYPIRFMTNIKLILFNEESSIYINDKNLRNNLIEKIRNIRLHKFEKKAFDISDTILTITDDEAHHLHSIGFKNTQNIPYGIDCEYFKPKLQYNEDKLRILFVGGYRHYPNREAIEIISQRIFPAFNETSGVEFIIVGRHCEKIRNKLNKNILVYDNVADIREFYNNADLFLAPIFSGGGLRIKILEAAASGLPILMTPLANLGIHLIHEKEALISNNIQEMINYIKNISGKKNVINLKTLGTNARKKIEDNFDKKMIAKRIENVFETYK